MTEALAAISGWVAVFFVWRNHRHERERLRLENQKLRLEIEQLEQSRRDATSVVYRPTIQETLRFVLDDRADGGSA
jgi:hypothetical protein